MWYGCNKLLFSFACSILVQICTTSVTKLFYLPFISETLRKRISDPLSNLQRNFVLLTNKNIPITNTNHVERKQSRPVSVARMHLHRANHDHIIVVQPNTVALWTTVAVQNYLRAHHQLKKFTKNRMPKKCLPTTTRTDYITVS